MLMCFDMLALSMFMGKYCSDALFPYALISDQGQLSELLEKRSH